jgi:importin subunit alpha-1
VDRGCIPSLCAVLSLADAKVVSVALDGLENLLKAGRRAAPRGADRNPFAAAIDACNGRQVLQRVATLDDDAVHTRANRILQEHFSVAE